MKRALLLYAKQKFCNMKSSYDQIRTSPNSTISQLAAPISPTPNLIIEAFLPRLGLNSNSFLVDLGCGDGRWLIAAHEHAKCRCLGIDVADDRLMRAQESISKNKLEELVYVRKQDVFEFVKEGCDIRVADVIVMYLFREAMMEIGTLLSRRYNDSQKIVKILSIGFALPGWTPVYEEKIGGIRVYLYSTRDYTLINLS
jgi:SAM-dependent methyltransferase